MEQDEGQSQEQDDLCPKWARQEIAQLREVEIFLGHIPQGLAWKSEKIQEIAHRLASREQQAIDESTSELLFKRIARGLASEGFSPQEISQFINARISYQGGPAYCNAGEVKSILCN